MRNECVKLLKELSIYEPEFYKSRAYSNASYSLLKLTDQEFNSREDYTDLYGIGSSINKKILEFKSTGYIHKLYEYKSTDKNSELYKVRNNFTTKRILLKDAEQYLKILDSIDAEFTVAGSIRRKKHLIGDIDVLVPEEDYPIMITGLINLGYSIISSGDYKTSFLIDSENNIQLDIISVTKENFIYQLLYLTGSKEHNIRMRSKAKSFGLTLNQYGLFNDKDENVLYARNEKEVFNYLEMNYLEPELR